MLKKKSFSEDVIHGLEQKLLVFFFFIPFILAVTIIQALCQAYFHCHILLRALFITVHVCATCD